MRLVRASLAYILMTLLVACAKSDSSATDATAAPTAPDMSTAIERYVVRRLNQIGEEASLAEHGGSEIADVFVTVAGSELQVRVYRQGELEERVGRRETFGGIDAASISAEPLGRVWVFGCALKDFGRRRVQVGPTRQAEQIVPSVHRALGCL